MESVKNCHYHQKSACHDYQHVLIPLFNARIATSKNSVTDDRYIEKHDFTYFQQYYFIYIMHVYESINLFFHIDKALTLKTRLLTLNTAKHALVEPRWTPKAAAIFLLMTSIALLVQSEFAKSAAVQSRLHVNPYHRFSHYSARFAYLLLKFILESTYNQLSLVDRTYNRWNGVESRLFDVLSSDYPRKFGQIGRLQKIEISWGLWRWVPIIHHFSLVL